MRVLVFGGNGFIGSHLVDDLLIGGHQVSVLDISKNAFRKELTEVEYFYGRLEDKVLVSKALSGIDLVCHLVSTTYPSNSNKNMVYDIESNLIATINLLNIMVEAKVGRIIYLSSGGTVYGPPLTNPISENHPLNPISSYGIVKLTIEKYLMLFDRLHNLKSLVLRPANVYGPRQGYTKMQGVTAHFLYNALQSKILNVWGDGSSSKDYIFVKDLTKAITLGVKNNEVQGVYNIGSGKAHSVNDIIYKIKSIGNSDIEVNYETSKSFDVQDMCLDITSIRTALKWSPQTSLEEGIRLQYVWMKDHLESLK